MGFKRLQGILFISVAGVMLLSGCGSKEVDTPQKIENSECIIAGESAPSWACGAYKDPNRYTAIGSAFISKLGHGFSRKEAIGVARANLAEQIEILVKSKVDSYMRSSGLQDQEMAERVITQLSKQYTELTLTNSEQISYWENSGDNSIYLMVAMDKKKVESSLQTDIQKVIDEQVDISTQQQNAKEQLEKL